MLSPIYRSIVTHGDLDGLGSAALCSWAYGVNRITFTGPVEIQNSRFSVTAEDIVCDLPCPLECGLWFDHHQGNADELTHRGICPDSVPGRFSPEPSCAHVIRDHLLSGGRDLPDHFSSLVEAVDRVDSFDYATLEEWRAETPEHVVSNAMRASFADRREQNQFFRNITFHLRDFGIGKAAQLREVRHHYGAYLAQEERMMGLLREDARPFDSGGDVVLVDLTRHNQKPFVWKNLAQLLFPDAGAVLSVEAAFRDGRKTTDLAFSMAHTIAGNRSGGRRDVGEIMRTLNLGDGHPGAGAGRVACRSKDEMLRKKEQVSAQIVSLWRDQERKERT